MTLTYFQIFHTLSLSETYLKQSIYRFFRTVIEDMHFIILNPTLLLQVTAQVLDINVPSWSNLHVLQIFNVSRNIPSFHKPVILP